MSPIHLLVTFDAHYAGPFRVMLRSAVLNNPGERFHIWLLHSRLPQDLLENLTRFCSLLGSDFTPLPVDRALFAHAPVSKQYPQEMYYRLLAPRLLPAELDRILYLDPDLLILNPLRPLWDLPLEGKAFAAASHTVVTDLTRGINRLRLGTEHDYYNTGVLLMDLKEARALVDPEAVFQCVRDHGSELLLPDQDVFNRLYGSAVHPVDDALWNYDARRFPSYLVRSGGAYDLDWVMAHTAILHFCGRRKPWRKNAAGRFTALYKHYSRLTQRAAGTAEVLGN